MHDQADGLRKLVQSSARNARAPQAGLQLVVLTSAEPRVGVSTLAVQLADEIAAIGRRVVLVDGHLREPSLARLLEAEPLSGLADVLAERKTVVESLVPVGENAHLLAAAAGGTLPTFDLQTDAVENLLLQLRTLHNWADVVLVDAGSGASPWAQRLVEAAGQLLLVTTTESSAVVNAYAALKSLNNENSAGKARLVINRVADRALADRIAEKFVSTCSYFLDLFDLPVSQVFAEGAMGEARGDSIAVLGSKVLRHAAAHQRRQRMHPAHAGGVPHVAPTLVPAETGESAQPMAGK